LIAENERIIRSAEFLDWEEVNACYHEHLQGDSNWGALHALVTFLSMPITKQLLGQEDRSLPKT
jgi:hypothetical protein